MKRIITISVVLVINLGYSLSMAALMEWPRWMSPAGSSILTDELILKIEDAELTTSARSYNAIQFATPNRTGVYQGAVTLFWHAPNSKELWYNSKGTDHQQSGVFELMSNGSVEVSFPGTDIPMLRLSPNGAVTLKGKTGVSAKFVRLSPVSSYSLIPVSRSRRAELHDFLSLSAPIVIHGESYSILKLNKNLASYRGTGIYGAQLGNMNSKGVFVAGVAQVTWRLDTRPSESALYESVFLRVHGNQDINYGISFHRQVLSRSDFGSSVTFTPLDVSENLTRYLTPKQLNRNATTEFRNHRSLQHAARSLECRALFLSANPVAVVGR